MPNWGTLVPTSPPKTLATEKKPMLPGIRGAPVADQHPLFLFPFPAQISVQMKQHRVSSVGAVDRQSH